MPNGEPCVTRALYKASCLAKAAWFSHAQLHMRNGSGARQRRRQWQ